MKRIKYFLILTIIFIFNVICFAGIKTFIKEDTAVVPANQTQDQVIDYLKQKLTRQATEEAGTFIMSQLNIKNYEITKDEFTSIAGSIAKIEILEEEPFVENRKQNVRVKLRIKINTKNVKSHLEKIMQDEEYKKEAEELRQKNLELERKLKTATKQQYEQKLSKQVKQQVELQRQQEIEFEKMVLEAKEEYEEAKKQQRQKDLQRQQQENKLKRQIEQEELETKKKLLEEKNYIKQQELENQAKIKELEITANKNMAMWKKTKKMSVWQAIKQAEKIKAQTDEIVNKFIDILVINKVKIDESYDNQVEVIKQRVFLEEKPVKDEWESTKQFKERLNEYEEHKKEFKKDVKDKIKELRDNKKLAVLKDEEDTLKAMVKTIQPFIQKIKSFQKIPLFDKNNKAEILSITPNVNKKYFDIKFEYQNKSYNYYFYFEDRKQAQNIFRTKKYFNIEPYFSIEQNETGEFIPLLLKFKIEHTGAEISNNMKISSLHEIDDLQFYTPVVEHLESKDKLEELILEQKLENLLKKKEKLLRKKEMEEER